MTIGDIPKLYTALAEWLSCAVMIMAEPKRRSSARIAGVLALTLPLLGLIHWLIGEILPIGFWLPGMALAMALMYAAIFACCRLSPANAGLDWALAFIAAEFIASLEWQLYAFAAALGAEGTWVSALFLLAVYGACYAFFGHLVRQTGKGGKPEIRPQELGAAIVIALAAFLLSNVSYVYPNTPFSGQIRADIFFIRTLVDFAGTVLLFAYQIHCQQLKNRREADAMHLLFQKQYEQYCQSRESIEMIHGKYHDLKHQIGIIRMETNSGKREEYLRELETGLEGFGAEQHTGNAVLDVILTTKKMYCIENGISLSVVADGSLLDFIGVMDLCSIFGNALDNAIESAMKLADRAKRLIRLAIYRQNDMVMIRLENYYESPIDREGEEFNTTKSDKSLHGYGLKSIRYLAGKYNGSVSIDTEDSWFVVKILLPLQ